MRGYDQTLDQLLCGIRRDAAAETLALAQALDLDVAKTLDLLNVGAAASFMLADRGARMGANRGFGTSVDSSVTKVITS